MNNDWETELSRWILSILLHEDFHLYLYLAPFGIAIAISVWYFATHHDKE